MKKYFINALTVSALLLSLGACKKDYGTGIGPTQDSIADIPVTVTNQDFFERVPIIVVTGAPTTPLAVPTPTTVNPFTITFQIPADRGTIKEITKVQTGASGLGLLSTGNPIQAYNYDVTSGAVKAIPGNGTNTISFTSSLAEYRAYRTRAAVIPAIPATATTAAISQVVNAGNAAYVQPDVTTATSASIYTAQAPNQLRYFFLLTLTDGTQIVPMEVRVRVLQ